MSSIHMYCVKIIILIRCLKMPSRPLFWTELLKAVSNGCSIMEKCLSLECTYTGYIFALTGVCMRQKDWLLTSNILPYPPGLKDIGQKKSALCRAAPGSDLSFRASQSANSVGSWLCRVYAGSLQILENDFPVWRVWGCSPYIDFLFLVNFLSDFWKELAWG